MFIKPITILLAVSGIFALSLANSVSNEDTDCPQICHANYEPVCAADGNSVKQFGNVCELEANNCRLQRAALQEFTSIDMDWCTSELVLGLDVLVKKLDNLNLETPECTLACPFIYSPVCISNGKYRALVSNECIANGINCALAQNKQAAFKILRNNSC